MSRRDVLLMKSGDLGWAGLASVLASISGVRVVGETPCPRRGVEIAATFRPDVILAGTRIADQVMPRVLLDLQRGPCPAAEIIFFSAGIDPDMIAATAGLRYKGWLLWPELSAEGLPHVLKAALFGEARLGSPSVVDALLPGGRLPVSQDGAPGSAPLRLACRERAVLALLALEGEAELTLAEIAQRLGIKTSSVATYVDRLGAKLGVRRGGRHAVVVAARRRGLVT